MKITKVLHYENIWRYLTNMELWSNFIYMDCRMVDEVD